MTIPEIQMTGELNPSNQLQAEIAPTTVSAHVSAHPSLKRVKKTQVKIKRRPIHGVILLNKPLHLSSNAALQKVRWLLRAEKGGHTGALDPLATGLLPLCFGEATKFSHYLLDADKTYQTTIQLGTSTTTGDREGEVVVEQAVPDLALEFVSNICQQFVGHTQQVPPMYSALKKDGKPLYELARAGIEVERAARDVFIRELSVDAVHQSSIELTVTCSKGTYIRTLGEDIAQALGTVGHLSRLHRVNTGGFVLDERITIEYLESLTEYQREELLQPCYLPVQHMPRVDFCHGEEFYFARGQAIKIDVPAGEYLIFKQQDFLGLATVDAFGMCHPKKVLNLPTSIKL